MSTCPNQYLVAVLSPLRCLHGRRHSLLRLPRRCALTSRHDPAAICFGFFLLWSNDHCCGGSVRNPTPSRECAHPRRLAVLCFSRPLKKCAHLTPFCVTFLYKETPEHQASRSALLQPLDLGSWNTLPASAVGARQVWSRSEILVGIQVTARLALNTSPVDRVGRPECRRVDQVRHENPAHAGRTADKAQNSDALTNQCDGLKGVKGSVARNQSEREGVIASNSLRSRHRMRQGDAVPRSQQLCAL